MQIYSSLKKRSKQLAILIDPDKVSSHYIEKLCAYASEGLIDYFLLGGSLLTTTRFEEVAQLLHNLSCIPVIIFPGSPMQISKHANALLLLSLISGRNPDLLIGRHVEAAPALKASGLEIISTGYMLIDSGKQTSASYMSNSTPIPIDKPDIAQCTAMAGEMLGMKTIYLEAGSGAFNAVPTEMIEAVADCVNIPIIVGGGIKDAETAFVTSSSGADLAVVGTSIEETPELVKDISNAVKAASTKVEH